MNETELQELIDEPSSQVKFSIEILTQHTKLTPAQRRAVHNLAEKKAREIRAHIMMLAGPPMITVRALRSSSSSGETYLDIYKE